MAVSPIGEDAAARSATDNEIGTVLHPAGNDAEMPFWPVWCAVVAGLPPSGREELSVVPPPQPGETIATKTTSGSAAACRMKAIILQYERRIKRGPLGLPDYRCDAEGLLLADEQHPLNAPADQRHIKAVRTEVEFF